MSRSQPNTATILAHVMQLYDDEKKNMTKPAHGISLRLHGLPLVTIQLPDISPWPKVEPFEMPDSDSYVARGVLRGDTFAQYGQQLLDLPRDPLNPTFNGTTRPERCTMSVSCGPPTTQNAQDLAVEHLDWQHSELLLKYDFHVG